MNTTSGHCTERARTPVTGWVLDGWDGAWYGQVDDAQGQGA